MYIIRYLWSKFLKKLPGAAIKNSSFEKPAKVEARSTIINSSFGYYSYCGYKCKILNAEIGRFCSIADGVKIGLENHPMDWVSTSCAFYYGKDSIPKDLARKELQMMSKKTVIGNDVWIGEEAIIMPGITIGTGAVIGAGAIVTSDIPAYAVAVGSLA